MIRVRAVHQCVFASAMLLFAVGCRDAPRKTLSDRVAAHQFASAAKRYNAQVLSLVDVGHAKAHARKHSCSALVDSRLGDLRMAEVEQTFQNLIVSQLLAPAYVSFAAELKEIPTENNILRTLAEVAASTVDDAVPKVQGADADECTYVKRWQRKGWSKRFGRKLSDAPFTIFGVDRDLWNRSIQARDSVVRRNDELGLRQKEWLDLSLAIGYPIL